MTPPAESIGGKRKFQEDAFKFSKTTYDYLVKLEELVESEEFKTLDEEEQDLITREIKLQNAAYELLWSRVDKY